MDNPSGSLMQILRPYYILSRAIGVRAFNCRSRLKSKLGLCIPFFLGVYYIFEWFLAEIRSGECKQNYKFELVTCLYYTAFVLRFLTVISSIAVGLLRSKTWEYTARSLNDVNKTLEDLGSKAQFRGIYTRLLIELTIFFAYLIISSSSIAYTIFYRTKPKGIDVFAVIMFIFSYIYSEIVEYTVTMDFLTLVRCIRSEVQRANDLLNEINILPISSIAIELIKNSETNNNLFKKVFTIAPLLARSNSHLLVKRNEIFRIRRLLRTIRHVQLELYRISKNLSALYGIQISLGMAMNIFYGMCYFYTLYTLRHQLLHGKFLLNELLMMNLFCIFVCGKVILVNFTCDRATQDAEKTGEIIYTFYAEHTDYEIQQEVKMFSLQMMHSDSSYSAFGLYVFNCKHICACLGVMTTYLVIMIQMTASREKK